MRFVHNLTSDKCTTIRNPSLSPTEKSLGCELLIDSGADTSVVGRHGFVTEIIEGITVSAQGFSDSQPTIDNLQIVNALYAYDHPDSGEIILLELNYTIYMGTSKIDAIACPN